MALEARRSRPERGARRERDTAPLPRILRPQLATLVDRVPEGDEWLHEIKHDGYRVLCRRRGDGARLYSRNGNDLTARMAAVAHAVAALAGFGDAWIDGEVVALEADGRASFPALQAALSERRDRDLVYYVFDLPYAEGQDFSQEPLLARKRRLARLLSASAGSNVRVRYSDHIQGDGAAFYEQACRFGLEGVVSKRGEAPYRGTRGRDWVKTKCRRRQEFLVCGYTEPSGSRAGLGALVLGVHDATGRLVYSGRTGTGFDAASLEQLRRELEPRRIEAPPFPDPLSSEARRGVTWVRPDIVVEVAFAGWTRDSLVRQASFQGVREDKLPHEVVREVPQALPPAVAPAAGARAGPAAARRLTNADKVLYPEQGLTKGDLATYYAGIADWILPYVARRPLTLLRCPDGRHRQCFFQKHARDAPAELRRVPAGANAEVGDLLALDSLNGLFALVQLGTLEIHVWNARLDRLELPDQIVLDLDPDPALPWKTLFAAAQLARARLLDLGLAPFVRTTGGVGLHVVAPLRRHHAWPEVRRFAKALAADIARHDPSRYTLRAARAERRGRIYIDYLRNVRGATAIANYSTRARAGAPVAVPLAWDELTAARRPPDYNVRTVSDRMRALGHDPWQEFDGARRRLTASMRRALGLDDD